MIGLDGIPVKSFADGVELLEFRLGQRTLTMCVRCTLGLPPSRSVTVTSSATTSLLTCTSRMVTVVSSSGEIAGYHEITIS